MADCAVVVSSVLVCLHSVTLAHLGHLHTFQVCFPATFLPWHLNRLLSGTRELG